MRPPRRSVGHPSVAPRPTVLRNHVVTIVVATAAGVAALLLAGLETFVGPTWRNPGLQLPPGENLRGALVAAASGEQGRSEWRLNVGHAIDVLRKDIVALFQRRDAVFDFSIFSEDIEVYDAHMPNMKLRSLSAYRRFLHTLQWSVSTTCDRSRLEIMTVSPPVDDEVFMRWQLHLWPRDPLASAKGLFYSTVGDRHGGLDQSLPFMVEGYSRYRFDPWTAEIVSHTIDITNPPTSLGSLIQGDPNSLLSWLQPAPLVPGAGTRLGLQGSRGSSTASTLVAAPHGVYQFSSMRQRPGERGAAGARGAGRGATTTRATGDWLPSMPQPCEDDFECNDGKANFPLQCCDLVVGNFCCEPEDPTGGLTVEKSLAWVPIQVPAGGDLFKSEQGI